MSEIQATYTVEGVTFETKKEARAYRAVCEKLDRKMEDWMVDGSERAEYRRVILGLYRDGIFNPPKVGRGPAKAK